MAEIHTEIFKITQKPETTIDEIERLNKEQIIRSIAFDMKCLLDI